MSNEKIIQSKQISLNIIYNQSMQVGNSATKNLITIPLEVGESLLRSWKPSGLYHLVKRFQNAVALVQWAGTAEYTLCISTEREDHPKGCSGYDTKQSDDESSVMQEIWSMQSTPSLTWLQAPLWSGVVAPNNVLRMHQVELNCVITLNWIVWN